MAPSTEEQRSRWRKEYRGRYARHHEKILAQKKVSYQRNKKYYQNWNRERAQRIRAFITALKDVPCMDCGGRFPAVCMDFDHREGTTKLINVSNLVLLHAPEEAIREEIAKCDLVCANCHRLRTQTRREIKRKEAGHALN